MKTRARLVVVVALILILAATAHAQEREGLMFGIEYNGVTMQNPYVEFSGNAVTPTDFQEV